MGQCGCGETWIKRAFRVIGTDFIIGVQEYHGCKECNSSVGLFLSFFTLEGAKEWIDDDLRIEPVLPDAYGAFEGRGAQFWLIGREELYLAAAHLEAHEGLRIEDYGSLEDLLHDYGLRLIQAAMDMRPDEEPHIARKNDPLSCARRFLLAYFADFAPRTHNDLVREVLGLDPESEASGAARGITPLWDRTPFAKALAELVSEGKVEMFDDDGWRYQLKKPLPFRHLQSAYGKREMLAHELNYLLRRYGAKLVDLNDLPCNHDDIVVRMGDEEIRLAELGVLSEGD